MIGCLSSCKKKDPVVDEDQQFDVGAFLLNAADNVIVPAYDKASSEAQNFQSAVYNFTADPSEENLLLLQSEWKEAFIAWQGAVPFNFGPAEDGSFKTIQEDINIYPVNTDKIEGYVNSGDNSLDNFDRDTRGFSGVDYLINKGTSIEVVNSFDTNRKAYLEAIAADIVTRIENVRTLWKESYRDEFVGNTSTSAGSSISYYYNNFVISYEGIKTYKLALPAGMGVGQSDVAPELLEAYYGEVSLDLVKANMTSVENIWYGKSSSGLDGIGFDDFLLTVDGTVLKSATITSLDNVWSKVNAIPEGSMIETLNKDPATVKEAVYEMQKHTRYFKSDLSAKIGVAITFSDGDGD